MKNRIFALLAFGVISLSYVSCSKSTTENSDLYEQAIEKKDIKQRDIG